MRYNKSKSIRINLIRARRCCSTLPTCLAMSAKLICVRRWVWDEFISAGWESGSHMLVLLGTWEPYPYFPRGGSRCNPDRGMAALNGVEIGEGGSVISGDCRERAPSDARSRAEVHILNVTCLSLCYLMLWYLLIVMPARLRGIRGKPPCWRCRLEVNSKKRRTVLETSSRHRIVKKADYILSTQR